VLLVLLNILGIALTALTLPGIWLMLLVAGLAQWWQVSAYGTWMFSWWTLGVCGGLALLAEIIEFVASALGAAKFGGTRWGALGSIVGTIAGAVAGSFFLFPLGTILGAAAGAGAGALLCERHIGKRTWEAASKAGAGAAIGRLAATLVKVGVAVVVAVILSVAAFVP
jgi:uncharacterized protein YqgC (DUF456 family)